VSCIKTGRIGNPVKIRSCRATVISVNKQQQATAGDVGGKALLIALSQETCRKKQDNQPSRARLD